MSKQSLAARAAKTHSHQSRTQAIDSYTNLRDWSYALIDLIEVAGVASGKAGIQAPDSTLTDAAGLLRDLMQQIDASVDVIREGA
jgi:hypothetical protein